MKLLHLAAALVLLASPAHSREAGPARTGTWHFPGVFSLHGSGWIPALA